MKILFVFYALSVVLVAALATVAICAPRRTAVRVSVVVLVLTLLPSGYLALTETLG